MIDFIDTLETKLHSTEDWEEQFRIIKQLTEEKESCESIAMIYNERISRLGNELKYQEIIDHELEIVAKIKKVLNNLTNK